MNTDEMQQAIERLEKRCWTLHRQRAEEAGRAREVAGVAPLCRPERSRSQGRPAAVSGPRERIR